MNNGLDKTEQSLHDLFQQMRREEAKDLSSTPPDLEQLQQQFQLPNKRYFKLAPYASALAACMIAVYVLQVQLTSSIDIEQWQSAEIPQWARATDELLVFSQAALPQVTRFEPLNIENFFNISQHTSKGEE